MTARDRLIVNGEAEALGWTVHRDLPEFHWMTHRLVRGDAELLLRFTKSGRLTDATYREASWPALRGIGWGRDRLTAGVDDALRGVLPELCVASVVADRDLIALIRTTVTAEMGKLGIHRSPDYPWFSASYRTGWTDADAELLAIFKAERECQDDDMHTILVMCHG